MKKFGKFILGFIAFVLLVRLAGMFWYSDVNQNYLNTTVAENKLRIEQEGLERQEKWLDIKYEICKKITIHDDECVRGEIEDGIIN